MKVLSITPSRISLFGGGSDVDPYCSKYGGLCINMAINLRHYITLDNENKQLHFTSEDNPKFYNSILKAMEVKDIGIKHTYDNTIESGLGSSAAYAVGVIAGITRLKNLEYTRYGVAEKAWDVEVNKMGLYGGKQDQYISAYGGINIMEFKKNDVDVVPISRRFALRMMPHFLLFYMGFNRSSSKIQEGFKELTPRKKHALDKLKSLAEEAIEPMTYGNVNQIATLMRESWEEKKKSNEGITNERIDRIYRVAMESGAIAGKVLGAGGGGHFLFIIDPIVKNAFIQRMEKQGLKWIDFSIDWNGVETRIL